MMQHKPKFAMRSLAASRRRVPGLALGCSLLALVTIAPPLNAAQPAVPAGSTELMQALHRASDDNARPQVIPAPVRAPANAPNILVILTDDAGFAATSAFGGTIPTPTFDGLARQSLVYTGLNTTGVCSPTRASLLTGRNAQAVGMGMVADLPKAFPGYTTVIPKSAATIAEVLKQNGYNTAMFGKSHLTPKWEMGPFGPFDHWPTGLGFEYYYGFLNGNTSQWEPDLTENTKPVERPQDPDYNFESDIANRAVDYIHRHHEALPDKPFFIYYATGSTHAPHHAPKVWRDKFRGKFAMGWDVLRQQIFERQKRLGIIPKDAGLAPRPSLVPSWNSMSKDEQRLAQRLMEAYAGQMAYSDEQIGRVIQSLKDTGQFDNTLIFYIVGDNGASGTAMDRGAIYEQSRISLKEEDLKFQLSKMDDIGGVKAYNEYNSGWAFAMDTPFPWFKAQPSHFGGTRDGMVISLPAAVRKSGLRTQYAHVNDIVPTIYEITGIKPPQEVNGAKQQPFDGVSLAYTFDNPAAPSRHTTQIYSVVQELSIYHDGWVAATWPFAMPGDPLAAVRPLDEREWRLYDVSKDYSEVTDLSRKYPAKLAEMQRLLLSEGEKNNLFPIVSRKSLTPGFYAANGRTHFEYTARSSHLTENESPELGAVPFNLVFDADFPTDQTSGVILASGGRFQGYTLFLDRGVPMLTVNAVPPTVDSAAASRPVPAGHHVVQISYVPNKDRSSPAQVTFAIDGNPAGTAPINWPRLGFDTHETFDVGKDLVSPVDDRYASPNAFPGLIRKVTIDLKP